MALWRPKKDNYEVGNMQNGRDVWKRSVRRKSDSGIKIMHVRKIVLFRKLRTRADFYIKPWK